VSGTEHRQKENKKSQNGQNSNAVLSEFKSPNQTPPQKLKEKKK
jgi:hypothetical protein